MELIQPICRSKLTPKDCQFIGDALSRTYREKRRILNLLVDPDSRDEILDQKNLLLAILEKHAVLFISSYCYFYVLVRHSFLKMGMLDRIIADYVAAVLAEFTTTEKPFSPFPQKKNDPVLYLVDLLDIISKAEPRRQLFLLTHLGNYTLFLTGLFEDFLNRRTQRKAAPGIDYYESVGIRHFYRAGQNNLAREIDMEGLYQAMGDNFAEIRKALNEMNRGYLHLHEGREWKKVLKLLEDVDQLGKN